MSEYFGTLLLLTVLGNFLLALVTFVLLGKPSSIEGLLARLTGDHCDWHNGKLSETDKLRLRHLGFRLGRILLVVLFFWSFCTGMLLKWQNVLL